MVATWICFICLFLSPCRILNINIDQICELRISSIYGSNVFPFDNRSENDNSSGTEKFITS